MKHREVFFAHNGPGPYECYFGCSDPVTMGVVAVHHIDENRDNNSVENLVAAHGGCHARHHRISEWATEGDRRAAELAERNRLTKTGIPLTEEHRAKVSASLKGRTRGPPSAETREKIGAAQRGVKRGPLSEDHRATVSVGLQGHIISDETKAKISASLTGRPLSQETKDKISAATKGKPKSEEAKANMRAAQQLRAAEMAVVKGVVS